MKIDLIQKIFHAVLLGAFAYFMVAIIPTGWMTPIGVWLILIWLATQHRRR